MWPDLTILDVHEGHEKSKDGFRMLLVGPADAADFSWHWAADLERISPLIALANQAED